MGQYVFKFPSRMPPLTWRGLRWWMGKQGAPMVGTTVRVRELGFPIGERTWYELELYDLSIAHFYGPGPEDGQMEVFFPKTNDTHRATRSWISRIVFQNGLGGGTFESRCEAAWHDGGVLYAGLTRRWPIEGSSFVVTARPCAGCEWFVVPVDGEVDYCGSCAGRQGTPERCAYDAARLESSDPDAAGEAVTALVNHLGRDEAKRLVERGRELNRAAKEVAR